MLSQVPAEADVAASPPHPALLQRQMPESCLTNELIGGEQLIKPIDPHMEKSWRLTDGFHAKYTVVPVLDPAPCLLPLSLASHGKRQQEVKGLVLTCTLSRPLEASPRGSIRLRMSSSLPVYNRALLRSACCLRMGLEES